MTASADISALEAQWWKDWWAADFSWDGLAAKTMVHRGAEITLQDYWRGEDSRLIIEPGTKRRWTRLHCPLVFADGTPSPKARWSEADRADIASVIEARIVADHAVALDGAVIDSLGGAWDRPVRIQAGRAYVRDRFVLGAAACELHLASAWIGGAFDGRGRTITAFDFSQAILRGTVNFRHATLGGSATARSFAGTQFLSAVDFRNAALVEGGDFTAARFAGRVEFSEAVFTLHAQFDRAHFAGTTDFFGVRFLSRALFDGVECLDYIGFYKAAFVRRLSINDARFYGGVNLEGITDGDPIAQSPQTIHLVANDGEPAGLSGTLDAVGGPSENSFRSLPKLLARRAVFYEAANFSNRDLLSPSSFRDTRFHERAQFFGSDVHASVNFHGTAFRDALYYSPRNLPKYPEALLRLRFLSEATGDYAAWKKTYLKDRVTRRGDDFTADGYFDGLETSFRTLKQMMEDRRDRVREGEFFNLELRARRKRSDVPWWERVASFIYWAISDYGNSIFRPLVVMLLLYTGLSLVYFAMGDHENLLARGAAFMPSHLFSAFGFSWNNVFSPFSVLDPQRFSGGDPWAHDLVLSPDAGFDFRVKVIATLQSLLTLTLAFLAGLAGRRRFQIN